MKTINVTESQVLELASELAHNRMVDTLLFWGTIQTEDDVYQDDNGTLIYTDEAQDNFDGWYDYYLTQIESILK